ncbi:MAG TPA: glycerophosphodiester phosphodiesterase [Gemmatimonadaceae bacterium]|nr:glycerophosphodiester phosphodiesterase [Gemmatimonadaceae bacterium]
MLTVPDRLERVAHRGSPRARPENTLPGFLLALEHGADAVELDAHVTRDGVAVVHHDDSVAGVPIAGVRWPDLADVDLGRGARIPRLSDVLTAVGDRARVYVELKGRNIENVVIDVVRRHGHEFALHSFDHAAIARVAAKAPDMPTGVLLDKGTHSPVAELVRIVEETKPHPRDVWPHWSLVNTQFVRAAHQHDMRVVVWTVNSAEVARGLSTLHVDGVCTDDLTIFANL